MKLARPSPEEPRIGLTPLIDVVFLLLIFFMVTTSFVHEAGLAVSLPEAGRASPTSGDEPATVIVDAGNRVFVGSRQLRDRDELRDALAGLSGRTEALRIRADGRASHQAVVTVMDTAAGVGFRRIDIATRQSGNNE